MALSVGTVLVLGLSGRAARAHPEIFPSGTSAYATAWAESIDGGGTVLRIKVALLLGSLAAIDELRAGDGNADGHLDHGEARALQETLRDRTRRAFRIELDGTDVLQRITPTQWSLPDIGRFTAPERTLMAAFDPVTVELDVGVPLAARPHQMRIQLAEEPAKLVETELSVDVGPRWRLDHGFRGSAATETSASAAQANYVVAGAWPSAAAERIFTFAFSPSLATAQGQDSAASVRWARWLRTAALLLVIAFAVIGAGVYRRRSSP